MHNEKKFCALHGKDIYLIILTYALITITLCHAWLPDTSSKIMNAIGNVTTVKFIGNSTFPDHFTILNQDDTSILLGGRNTVYNLSVFDFTERRESRFEWPSTVPHEQLCILKGKTEDDCQNYIRILVNTEPDKMLICGTNSYKPLCRHYSMKVSFVFFLIWFSFKKQSGYRTVFTSKTKNWKEWGFVRTIPSITARRFITTTNYFLRRLPIFQAAIRLFTEDHNVQSAPISDNLTVRDFRTPPNKTN